MQRSKLTLFALIAFSLCTYAATNNPVVINNNNNNNNGGNNGCQNSATNNPPGAPAGVFNVPTAQGSNTIYSTGDAQPYNADMNNNNCNGQAPIYPQVYTRYPRKGGK